MTARREASASGANARRIARQRTCKAENASRHVPASAYSRSLDPERTLGSDRPSICFFARAASQPRVVRFQCQITSLYNNRPYESSSPVAVNSIGSPRQASGPIR